MTEGNATADDFWCRPSRRTQPSLTEEMLAATEQFLGVRLPRLFVNLLRRINGGYPLRDAIWIEPEDINFGSYHRFLSVMGIPENPDDAPFGTIPSIQEIQVSNWGWPERLIPFTTAEDDHSCLCLDYRLDGQEGSPRIAAVMDEPYDCDSYGELIGKHRSYIRVVAQDFETFVSRLFRGDKNTWFGLISQAPADEVAVALEDALETTMTESGSLSNYLYYADKKGWKNTARRPETHLSFLPNLREGYYDFPDHPECNYLLDADIASENRQELEACLAALPFPVQLLHLPMVD